jgi:hypothetical protein
VNTDFTDDDRKAVRAIMTRDPDGTGRQLGEAPPAPEPPPPNPMAGKNYSPKEGTGNGAIGKSIDAENHEFVRQLFGPR